MAPQRLAPSVLCAAILCLGVAIAAPALAAKGGNNKDAWMDFQALFDAMAHPNCLNCHAARQTHYTPGGDGDYGLPTGVGHPAFAPFASVGDEMDRCDDCHDADSLEHYRPGGVIDNELGGVVLDIRWHAAPIDADFRQLPRIPDSPAALCEHAKDPGSIATDAVDHMSNDPLILWAIGNGPTAQSNGAFKTEPGPFGAPPQVLEDAFFNVVAWRQLVADWAAAGMPCPPEERVARTKPSPHLAPFRNTGDLLLIDEGSDNVLRVAIKGNGKGNGAVSIEISQADIEAVVPQFNGDLSKAALAAARDGTIYLLVGNWLDDEPQVLLRKAPGQALENILDPPQGTIPAIAIGSDGHIYMLDQDAGRLLKVNVNTLAITEALDLTIFVGANAGIDDLVADEEGVFWFSAGANEVLRAETLASHDERIGIAFADNDQALLFEVEALTRAADGTLIVVDDNGNSSTGLDRLVAGAPTGELTTIVTTATLASCPLGPETNLEAAVFDGKGAAYVVIDQENPSGSEDDYDPVYRIDGKGCETFVTPEAFEAVTGVVPDFEDETNSIVLLPR